MASSQTKIPRRSVINMNLLVFLVALIFCLIIIEIGMRNFFNDNRLSTHTDERNLLYRYDRNLGWFPVENSEKLHTGTHAFSVKHNSRGFRDSEHLVDKKPNIVFIGDSFLWGYDVEESERFTDKLRSKLPDWTIRNLGVSGYGTDQEYILLKKHYGFYKSQIVFLLFCTDNDEADNSTNMRYGGYYKPYFVVNENNLELSGTPVPKSENYFFVNHTTLAQSYLFKWLAKLYFEHNSPSLLRLKNPTRSIIAEMNEFVKNKGAQFIVGLADQSPELEIFLTDKKIPFVSLSNSHRYPSYGRHWTPEGHTFVTEKIYDFLVNRGYLASRTASNNAVSKDNVIATVTP